MSVSTYDSLAMTQVMKHNDIFFGKSQYSVVKVCQLKPRAPCNIAFLTSVTIVAMSTSCKLVQGNSNRGHHYSYGLA